MVHRKLVSATIKSAAFRVTAMLLTGLCRNALRAMYLRSKLPAPIEANDLVFTSLTKCPLHSAENFVSILRVRFIEPPDRWVVEVFLATYPSSYTVGPCVSSRNPLKLLPMTSPL